MRQDLPEKENIIVEGYLMVINPLHRKTVMLNYTTVKTMDEESIDLGFLGLKMVLTADIFMFFEETKTHYYQLFYESVKLALLFIQIYSGSL